MPGRKYPAGNGLYRFGFNGQEKSNEVTEGNYTAEFWEYDSRIGRRWNVDPVNIGGTSGYATFANNPIIFTDPNGLDTVSSKKRGAANGTVYRSLSKSGNSYFYEKKVNGKWEDMGEVGNLPEVVVHSKTKKHGRYYNWMGIDNTPSRVWREDYWYYKNNGITKGLDADMIKRYDRWIQADKDWRAMSLITVGILASPLLLETGIVAGTDAFLWKMGLEGVGQIVVNGGDASKLDIFDMTLAGFSTPGASAFYGGAVDIRLNGEFSAVGYNKSWQTAAMDGAFKYAFGGRGVNGIPGNILTKVTFSTPLSTFERNIFLRCMSVPINYGGKALRKGVKENTGL